MSAVMDRLILILVRGRDRVADILPYLDDIARPGTKITFLMDLGTWRFRDQLDSLFSFQRDAKRSRFQGDEPTAKDNLAAQLRNLRSRLQDVEVELRFYVGSMRSLKHQLMQEHQSVIVMLPPASTRVMRWLYQMLYARFFSRPFVSTPVLLCHLGKQRKVTAQIRREKLSP